MQESADVVGRCRLTLSVLASVFLHSRIRDVSEREWIQFRGLMSRSEGRVVTGLHMRFAPIVR